MRETRFKDTEIGRVPEDWKMISLGDIGDVRMCKRVMKYQTSDKGVIPFYKIGTFGKQADAYISRELYNSYKAKYHYPRKGDILLSAAGTIGRTVIFDGQPSYFQDSNIVWIENPQNIVSNELLYYIYKDLKWVTESGTIPRIYNSIVRAIKFCIPTDKSEQSRIASALTSIDNLIFSLDKLIEKKKSIKQGTMQQLLTGKKRLKGFTEPWVERTLEDIFDFKKGTGLSKEKISFKGKYKCMLYGEIFTRFNYITTGEFYKTNYYEGTLSKHDDVLMPGSTTTNGFDLVKAVSISEDNVLLGGDIIILRKRNDDVDSYFWSSLISEINKQNIANKTQGITIIHLHPKSLSDIIYSVPPSYKEQQAIASVLKAMDKDIVALESKKAKFESIKQGMMQQLLIGKIRLISHDN